MARTRWTRCAEVTEETLVHALRPALRRSASICERTILKPNMVLPGMDCPHAGQRGRGGRRDGERACCKTVPRAVPGVAFLSGGQSAELASARLNAMHVALQAEDAVGADLLLFARRAATRARCSGPARTRTSPPRKRRSTIARSATAPPAGGSIRRNWRVRTSRRAFR